MPSKTLDIAGFKEKVLRRTGNQTTLKAYMKGVNRFEQFCKEQSKSVQDELDELMTGKANVYETLDRFVCWAMTQKDWRDGSPIMPRTVHRYMEGTKKLLRFHGIEISNDRFRDSVTMPVAEEIQDVAIDRSTIRLIILCGMPLWTRLGCAIMKNAGTRIGET